MYVCVGVCVCVYIYIYIYIYIYNTYRIFRMRWAEFQGVILRVTFSKKNAVSHPLDCNTAYADNYQPFSYIATRILMYLQVSKRKLYNVRFTAL